MFGLSGEHLLILAVVVLIFGPRKLPELGAGIGRALKNFKDGLNGRADEEKKLEEKAGSGSSESNDDSGKPKS